ncbi:MAG: S8 family serine peptidase, partial [Ignavibacteriaceae bacterium]|nr:S8 family serine peptidase [Ignavibacteriaceae bacterium]
MKKFIITFACFGLITIFAQSPLEKITPRLQLKMETDLQSSKHLVWIYFADKGNNLDGYYSNPESVVSQKSLDRRTKVFGNNSLIDFSDLPVNQNYINTLIQYGFELKQKSKWFNAISGFATQNQINQIALNSFINKIDVVGTYAKRNDDIEFNSTQTQNDNPTQIEGTHSLNYGSSFTQLNQMNVPAVHDSGYNGAGVTICVLDAGFDNLPHEVFSSMNIIAAYDFVNHDPNVANQGDMGEGSHGTATLSIIGGFKEGQLVGPAYGANFILAKTENTDTETPVEEDNWIAGLEWADSIGVDVTSTSLGYIDFDPPYTSYTWQTMDGNTAIITIGADLAAKKGIVVVNSAGNEGSNSLHNTLGAPADGDSVFTIGAVTSTGNRSSFSSVGPTVDGRTKPDLMAMGSNVYHAGSFGNQYYTGGGTSYSCPLAAGVCALILQKNPSLTPMEVLQILRSTASRSTNPDNLYGWGIINALSAINSVIVPVELTLFNAVFENGEVNLQWITATELNNFGFEIERRDDFSSYQKIGFIDGNGTSTNRITYNFIDQNLSSNRYYYRLKQLDFDGSFEYSSEVAVDIETLSEFKLFQNYPNPFNPTTNIKYYVPDAGKLKIGLYDVLGNELTTLVNKEVQAG